jgi:hypothetical protein
MNPKSYVTKLKTDAIRSVSTLPEGMGNKKAQRKIDNYFAKSATLRPEVKL